MKNLTKKCPKCGVSKEIHTGNFRLRNNGNFDNVCKKCAYDLQKPKQLAWNKEHTARTFTPEQREARKEYHKSYKSKNPWVKAFKNSKTRCNNDKNSSYFKRGIEHTLHVKDFREAWMKSKAYDMDFPSINRIDPNKGYIPGNIEYLELEENLHGKKARRYAFTQRDY